MVWETDVKIYRWIQNGRLLSNSEQQKGRVKSQAVPLTRLEGNLWENSEARNQEGSLLKENTSDYMMREPFITPAAIDVCGTLSRSKSKLKKAGLSCCEDNCLGDQLR